MHLVMRRPSSWLEPEGAGRPGVDLDEGTVDDAPPVEGGVPFGALVQGAMERRRPPPSAAPGGRPRRPPSAATSPRVTETTASTTSASGPCRSTIRTCRSIRPPPPARRASTARTTSFGRLAQAHVGEADASVGTVGAAAVEDDLGGPRLISSPLQGRQRVQRRRGGDGGGRHDGHGTRRGPAAADRLPCRHGRCGRPGGPQRPRAGPAHRDRPPRRAGGARQRPLGSGRDPRRRRRLAPARHAPLLPALHGGRAPRPRLVAARGGAPGPGPGRALPPLRGDRAGRGRPPAAHRHRRRLHAP